MILKLMNLLMKQNMKNFIKNIKIVQEREYKTTKWKGERDRY